MKIFYICLIELFFLGFSAPFLSILSLYAVNAVEKDIFGNEDHEYEGCIKKYVFDL